MTEKQILSADTGVRLWVPGRPRTKGSLVPRHVPGYRGAKCKVWLTESGEYSAEWKQHMVTHVRQQAECLRYDGPVEVHAFFRFEREGVSPPGRFPDGCPECGGKGGHPVSCSHSGMDPWPVGRQYGDEDKLRRNLLDALTQSALLADDSLVVGGQTWKRFALPGEQSGAALAVQPARAVSDVVELERAMVGRHG